MADVSKIIKGGLKVAKEIAEGSAARKPIEVAKRKELAPVLERSKPYTDEELRAFAERMAPQINKEFYKPNPKKSLNPVDMSYSRWKAEQELKHTIVPTRDVPKPIPYDPAKWEGHVLSSIVGDPTIGDKAIVDINGRKLISPSKQEAGSLYGLGEPTDAWASTEDAAKSIQGRMIDTSNRYNAPVLGVYTKMGPGSYAFANHVEDVLLKHIVTNIDNMTDKQINAFNKLVRNHTPEFAGIENPDIVLEQFKADSELRKKFFAVATKKEHVKTLGIPNGLDAIHAALEPDLRYLETGASGHSVIQMDPSKKILLPAEHTTYTHRIPRLEGTEIMQSEAPIPYQLQYPDQLLEISKNPDQAPRPFGTISMGGASQINDAQHVDQISKYLEYIKKLTGKKKGGAVKMADGGKVFKAALKLLKEAGEETTEAAVKLPPAENSARTQIVGTIPTYHKARDILKGHGVEGEKIIDLGAGKGLGSTIMKAHSMEPYAQGWEPTFTRAADIPSDTYEGLTNLNVLNVVSPEIRRGIVEDIGRVLKPQGGVGLITTRGKDVLNTVGGKPGPEPMSMITSRDTYQKGFTQQELYDYIKDILGDKFEYEKLDLGPAGVKVIKKAKGGAVEDDTDYIEEDPVAYLMDKIKPVKTSIDSPEEFSRRIGKPIPGVNPAIEMLRKGVNPVIKALREDIQKIKPRAAIDVPVNTVSEILGAPVDIANELREPVTPIRSDIVSAMKDYKLPTSEALPGSSKSFKKATTDIGLTSGEDYPALQFAAGMVGVPEAKAIGAAAKAGVKGYGNLIKEGVERNIGMFEPRMGIIKDPGGMLVGGEKALDEELRYMKKPERFNIRTTTNGVTSEAVQEEPNSVALNKWIDTKVKKYLRNQAGSEADPILKAIESGVEHNFQPAMGDTKYAVKTKRFAIGKPEEGIAKTDLGKEWEYKVDSMFDPHSTTEIKEILNNPMEFADPATAERRRASLLRVEHDLPIDNEKDVEALRLINQIPDQYVHTLSGTNITERLGLKHVGDVLLEDLNAGRLTREQLDQMSIEKAVRRAAEYDAEKAKAMVKASAQSIEGMPVPKQYDDGFKWVELKHESDPKKTAAALKSEGEMMGHCVGSYCPQVESGRTKIYSLRSPDGKSHVTIEVNKNNHLNDWLEANKEEINKDPLLKQMSYYDADEKYPGMYSEEEVEQAYIADITKMLKAKGAPVYEAPNSWIDIVQVKGKQNKRPDDKYQKYVSDFIKNNPTGHEIADIHELNNTNLRDIQGMIATGLTSKTIHMHPDVEKAVAKLNPHLADKFAKHGWSDEIGDAKYKMFSDIARDFASKGNYYVTEDEILDAVKAKHLTPLGKKRGGPITKKDLENQMKIDNIVETPNLRRRYG
jgi:hypothetical protein